ncbi:hypothetical protein GCM10007870_11860 [Gluconobacter kondonii]|uniref:Uncharacterized protein n=1 Tax=Gluconobacter kondonii TaxID=941463 RepID=A0ABQ5WSF4_9PROT|nr:hypothetical protein GCM10007870_11860 [Gluconobacter kondonii]
MGHDDHTQPRQNADKSRQNAQPDLVATHQSPQIQGGVWKQPRLKAVQPLAQDVRTVLKRGGTGGQAGSRAAGVILFDGKRAADQQLSWKDHR